MSDRIKTRKAEGTWVVRAGGAVIGETRNAVEVSQDGKDPAIYFPREDVAMAFLELSDGEGRGAGTASHYALHSKSTVIEAAAWSYEDPQPGLEAITGHLSFDPDKVTVERL